jgi:DNA polymerase-3 subunit beta
MVSTDSYRLSWKDISGKDSIAEWEDCIVPTKTLNEVARIAGTVEDDVEMKMQEKQVMFKLGDLAVSSRLIEGQFPNYRQLIPKGEKISIKANKEELSSVIKRALVFGHNLRLGIYRDHIGINTETPEVGDSKEEMPAEVEGEEMEIGFNGAYLLDGVSVVETERVEMRMDDPQKPALIKDEDSDKFNYILMPVRLR